MSKFYLVDKTTSADDIALARVKGLRIVDRKFASQLSLEDIANLPDEKPKARKPRAKKVEE